MKKIMFVLLAVSIGLAAFSQKIVNDANAEKRNVGGFTGVKVESGIDLYISQGDDAVAVSAAETSVRDKIKTEVTNGVLRIYIDYKEFLRFRQRSANKLRAYVSIKNIESLYAGGGCDVFVEGTLKSSSLSIGISGGSDFSGKVDVNDLKLNASGGSDVKVSGRATTLSVDASGGSDVKGFDLAVDNCTIDASGGSDVSITANKELNVQSSGGSDVHYKGSAVIRNVRSSGGGSVRLVSGS